MKVLGIYASPRKGGNSDTLLDEAMKAIHASAPEAEFTSLRVSDLELKACNACMDCFRTYKCSIKDDDFGRVFKVLMEADIVIISTPIYFMGPPSPLKALIDRCLVAYAKRIKKNKDTKFRRFGGIIMTAGQSDEKMFCGTRSMVKSLYWSIDAGYKGEVLSGGMDKYKNVGKCPTAMKNARKLGMALAKAAGQGRTSQV
jgi:multimeric flavodoxin WrbA